MISSSTRNPNEYDRRAYTADRARLRLHKAKGALQNNSLQAKRQTTKNTNLGPIINSCESSKASTMPTTTIEETSSGVKSLECRAK